jgi:hypothetical protein
MKATRRFHVEFKATLADDALEGTDATLVSREGDRVVVEVEAPDRERAVQRVEDALGPGGGDLEVVRVHEPPGAGR